MLQYTSHGAPYWQPPYLHTYHTPTGHTIITRLHSQNHGTTLWHIICSLLRVASEAPQSAHKRENSSGRPSLCACILLFIMGPLPSPKKQGPPFMHTDTLYIHKCIYVDLYIYIQIYSYICIYICIYTRIYIYIHISLKYVYMLYIYI